MYIHFIYRSQMRKQWWTIKTWLASIQLVYILKNNLATTFSTTEIALCCQYKHCSLIGTKYIDLFMQIKIILACTSSQRWTLNLWIKKTNHPIRFIHLLLVSLFQKVVRTVLVMTSQINIWTFIRHSIIYISKIKHICEPLLQLAMSKNNLNSN